MRQISKIYVITIFALCSNLVHGQSEIGIQLPYFIDNPTAVQTIPEDTIDVRCDYCSGEVVLDRNQGCGAFPRFETKMDFFRHYFRRPLASISETPMTYGAIVAILDTVTLKSELNYAEGNDSVICFSMLIWNMGEYFDTNCRHYNGYNFPLSANFEDTLDATSPYHVTPPHIDSVYLLVIKDETSTILEMTQTPENNKFLFWGWDIDKYENNETPVFLQFFPKTAFDITKMYSTTQLKRYYMKNRHRVHRHSEKRNGKTYYYCDCD